MLRISLNQAAKRYHLEWVFKSLDLELKTGDALAVTGPNGSGKSTLLKCISGVLPLTQGEIAYFRKGQPLEEGDFFKHLSFSAPYMELPEEFTLVELLAFHFKFKSPQAGISIEQMIQMMVLEKARHKAISNFSSGMKQRLKLGLCFYADNPLLLLDEPTSNLDQAGVDWYLNTVNEFGKNKIMVVCSNDPREYGFCNQFLNMDDYKVKARL
ncbi:ABC transporter ATP-binding protein [Pararhodonellum marinum]|uniref:ABC transporter ATP-binding protein n=1 Tax=Pararhodonellum marinum TaxID=2755358 RepID=UPI00188E5E5A|nr:ATP-binding cassette domain-containing protein [Pararhodonellum marinum]